MFIKRLLEPKITEKLFSGRAIIIYGARQVGKTTLLKQIIRKSEKPSVWYDADTNEVKELFNRISLERFKLFLPSEGIVVIDEAQNITQIGKKIKVIIDHFPHLQLLISGSSSFELSQHITEPLTGRKWEYRLFPLSFEEMARHHGTLTEHNLLSERLIYGYYPEVVIQPQYRMEILKELSGSYIFKDILTWHKIRKSDKIVSLLRALAFQVGYQVSYKELGDLVGLNHETVAHYIDLLEKSFVIFRLPSYSRNRRNELKRSRKIYFVDNGIRNALIRNFNPLELRNDVSALWENFIISERMKFISYNGLHVESFFWRTSNQQEIDYLEETEGSLYAYEIKFNTKKRVKPPRGFVSAYPNAHFSIISPNPEDYIPFISAISP